jgi:hypothetical protein
MAIIGWAALTGFCIGACIGIGLLYFGQDRFGTEAMEGSAMLGFLLSMPLSELLSLCFDWGGYASQWAHFLAIVPAANGAMLGAIIGCAFVLFRRLMTIRPPA